MLGINKVNLGDCLELIKSLEDNSIDAIVTDPPYELTNGKNSKKGFMGKEWDGTGIAFNIDLWKECLRVLKPGAHLVAFSGSRTEHRMTCAIEDAGFEIRDKICWIFSQGFPKSLNIQKQLVKQNHHEADKYKGFGTALKPAVEYICLARKPLEEKTIVENVLKYGCGAIDIDGCRIPIKNEKTPTGSAKRIYKSNQYTEEKIYGDNTTTSPLGRFPANVICTDDVLNDGTLDKGTKPHKIFSKIDKYEGYGNITHKNGEIVNFGDSGSKSRYFDLEVWAEKHGILQFSKASKSERNKGCEDLENKKFTAGNYSQSPVCKTCNKTLNGTNDHSQCTGEVYYREMGSSHTNNHHPTVKPISVISWLVRLISKEGDIVLDPFAGSGTTGVACAKMNRKFVLMEKEQEYIPIIEKRIEYVLKEKEMEII